jgi:uncharacterized surface protein with fasciclin (FAS1) repeats
MNTNVSRFTSAPSAWQNRLNHSQPQRAAGMMTVMMNGLAPENIHAQYNTRKEAMMLDMTGIRPTQQYVQSAPPQGSQAPYPPTPQQHPQPHPQHPQFYQDVANLYYQQADLYSQQAAVYGQLAHQFANFVPVGMTPSQPSYIGDPNGLNTFSGVIGASGFSQTLDQLESQGPVTVFAPTNEAFQLLNPNILEALQRPENAHVLQEVLEYHVADRAVSFKGRPLRIDSLSQRDESILIGDAQNPYIINNQQIARGQAAIRSQNGSITIPIDQVLLPPAVDVNALMSGGYARHPQPQYSQPQYSQPQYSQPQYSQPQYSQPQYSQHPQMSAPPSSVFAMMVG